MMLIHYLSRIIALAGVMIIVASFAHVVSVHDVLRAWSSEIDAQELVMDSKGDDAVRDILNNLFLYCRVASRFEHLNGNWLYTRVLIGLILLFPWCVTIKK